MSGVVSGNSDVPYAEEEVGDVGEEVVGANMVAVTATLGLCEFPKNTQLDRSR